MYIIKGIEIMCILYGNVYEQHDKTFVHITGASMTSPEREEYA